MKKLFTIVCAASFAFSIGAAEYETDVSVYNDLSAAYNS